MRQLASWFSSRAILPSNSHAWHDFVDITSSQGLAGLALTAPLCDSAPSWAVNSLRVVASRVAASNLHMLQELGRTSEAFHRAGIPLMVLKGAALHLSVYPRRDLRSMSDLDLLVAPHDAVQAVELLKSIGYSSGASLIREDFFPTQHYEKEMILPGLLPVRVDLHAHPWRPMQLAQIVAQEAFWEDAIEVPMGDTSILIPGPSTMFIHLAAHAAFHDCSRFIWLYDLKALSEHYADVLDWKAVAARAMQWQVTLAVRKAIEQAESLFGEICPRDVMRKLADAQPTWRERLTLWHTPRDASSPLVHVACNLACLRGVKRKAAYLAAMLAPGKGHLAASYPFRHAGWTWCAQAMRALRTVGRAVSVPLSLLRRALNATQTQGVPC